jgi:anti-sigma regulatory factor (Ser/Thr protein kinase)
LLAVSRAFPSAPEAASAARGFVREAIDTRVSPAALGDALLLTTELVTNAYRHAVSEAGEQIEVEVSIDHEALRVTVRDRGEGFDPEAAHIRTDEGGWGLDLMKAVASDWGVEPVDGATEVWFELDPEASGT